MATRPRPRNPARVEFSPGPPYVGRWAIAGRPIVARPAYVSAKMVDPPPIRAAQTVWAADAHRNLAPAAALQQGTFGPVAGSLCSPLAAALIVLVSPHTSLYAAGVLLVLAPPLARAAPRGTLVLALLAPVALVVAFPLWIASVGLRALAIPRERWPGFALGISVVPPQAAVIL